MPEKLSQGPRNTPDASRTGAGLTRGPGQRRKYDAAPWSGTWPAPGSTLDLDFANDRGWVRGVGQGRSMDAITFTRASSGTFVGPDGLLKGSGGPGNNLLAFPDDFDRSLWQKSAGLTVIPNTDQDPNLGQTADSLIFASINQTLIRDSFGTGLYGNTGQVFTFSVFLRVSSGTAAVRILTGQGGTGGTSNANDVTVTTSWQRFSVTHTMAINNYLDVIIRNLNYVGTLLAWGAMIETGSTASDYWSTNVNVPRFDWGSTTQTIQPNLFTFTEQFDNPAWAKSHGSVTMSGSEGLFIPDTSNNAHIIGQSLDAGATRTFTIEVKAAGYSRVALVESVNSALQSRVVDLNTGAVLDSQGSAPVVTPLTDGWYRIVWTSTFFSQFNSGWHVYVVPNTGVNIFANIFNQSWVGDGVSGIRIRFPQIELGSVATAYQYVGITRALTAPLLANPTCNGLLVEEARTNRVLWCRDATAGTGTNMLTFSEQFDNAAWAKSNSTVLQNATIAPDGTTTADKLIEGVGVNRGRVVAVGVTTAVNYTFSVYAKAAEWNRVGIGTSNSTGLWGIITFNLSTGTVDTSTSYGGSLVDTPVITDVGNGWYRCSVRVAAVAAGAIIMPFNQTGDPVNPSPSLVGDGTSGIFIWGAQLFPSAVLTDYQPTTTAALFGWSKSAVTVAKNQVGIDGVDNAATSITATSNNAVLIQPIVLASGSRTSSVYLKRLVGTGAVQVSLDGSSWSTVDLSSVDWRRCILSSTVTNPVVAIRLLTSGDSVAMDYAQVEDGLIATSPILTTAAAVTRAQDVAEVRGGNFTTWYNPKECTLSVESFNSYTYQAVIAYPTYLNQSLSMSATFVSPDGSVWGLRTGTRGNFTVDSVNYFYSGGGTDEGATIFNIVPVRMVTKMSGSVLLGTSFSTSYFGLVAKAYDSSTQFGSRSVLTATSLRIGSASLFTFNGTVKRIVYYPKCYSDTAVAELSL